MENRILSLILDTDSYKFSQAQQYPPNTTYMFSYFESRGSEGNRFPYTVFFGLQYYLKEYLTKQITVEDVEEAYDFCKLHGEPFNYTGWMGIVKDYDGYIPVRIRAIPEGSIIPGHNILMSVESTDTKYFWVVNYIETLLVRVWYPTTVATQSWYIKNLIKSYLERTADSTDGLLFKCHDFGARGVSSQETAMIGGAAHLTSFRGSDTVAGIWMANKYYNCEMSGFSIPASEHSTITTWGKDNEVDAYRNMLKLYENYPLFACVSDSYDIYNAAENIWGGELISEVKKRTGLTVIRPDSGDPVTVVCKLLQILDSKFGATVNTKGYRVLNNVRIIQGDGVNINSIGDICKAATNLGYSTDNIAFGSGGALLQQLNRDTLKFAFKCSGAIVDGEFVDVFKTPVTDPGKNSKKGMLDLHVERFSNQVATTEGPASVSMMETVFENGKILKEYTLDEIRKNTEIVYGQYRGWMDNYYPVRKMGVITHYSKEIDK